MKIFQIFLFLALLASLVFFAIISATLGKTTYLVFCIIMILISSYALFDMINRDLLGTNKKFKNPLEKLPETIKTKIKIKSDLKKEKERLEIEIEDDKKKQKKVVEKIEQIEEEIEEEIILEKTKQNNKTKKQE